MVGFRSSVLIFVFLLGVFCAFSQSPTPTPSVNRMENLRPLNDRDYTDFSRRTAPENLPSEYRVSSKALKKTKLTDAEKAFYKDAKSGGVKVLKLFIAPKCADNAAVNVGDPRCAENYDYLPISFYSFFDGIYGQLYGELRVLEDHLIAGHRHSVHGFLLDLGEADLAALDKRSPPVKKLADYEIAKTRDEAEKQKTALEKGIEFEGETFSSRKKYAVNHTYLMRIVAYGQARERISPYNYDAVIAFRVDRLTTDNMIIILWKKLAEKNAPRLD